MATGTGVAPVPTQLLRTGEGIVQDPHSRSLRQLVTYKGVQVWARLINITFSPAFHGRANLSAKFSFLSKMRPARRMLLYISVTIMIAFFIGFFQVNGEWSSWSSWTKCSKTCGGGNKIRKRTCSNPAPANGGRGCQGSNHQSSSCNSQLCPGKERYVLQ